MTQHIHITLNKHKHNMTRLRWIFPGVKYQVTVVNWLDYRRSVTKALGFSELCSWAAPSSTCATACSNCTNRSATLFANTLILSGLRAMAAGSRGFMRISKIIPSY